MLFLTSESFPVLSSLFGISYSKSIPQLPPLLTPLHPFRLSTSWGEDSFLHGCLCHSTITLYKIVLVFEGLSFIDQWLSNLAGLENYLGFSPGAYDLVGLEGDQRSFFFLNSGILMST